jgi:hypothetical protein
VDEDEYALHYIKFIGGTTMKNYTTKFNLTNLDTDSVLNEILTRPVVVDCSAILAESNMQFAEVVENTKKEFVSIFEDARRTADANMARRQRDPIYNLSQVIKFRFLLPLVKALKKF